MFTDSKMYSDEELSAKFGEMKREGKPTDLLIEVSYLQREGWTKVKFKGSVLQPKKYEAGKKTAEILDEDEDREIYINLVDLKNRIKAIGTKIFGKDEVAIEEQISGDLKSGGRYDGTAPEVLKARAVNKSLETLNSQFRKIQINIKKYEIPRKNTKF